MVKFCYTNNLINNNSDLLKINICKNALTCSVSAVFLLFIAWSIVLDWSVASGAETRNALHPSHTLPSGTFPSFPCAVAVLTFPYQYFLSLLTIFENAIFFLFYFFLPYFIFPSSFSYFYSLLSRFLFFLCLPFFSCSPSCISPPFLLYFPLFGLSFPFLVAVLTFSYNLFYLFLL